MMVSVLDGVLNWLIAQLVKQIVEHAKREAEIRNNLTGLGYEF